MAVATQNKNVATIVESFGDAARVDREAGIIRGVKVIGMTSKNGRDYPAKALQSAVHLYESAKVNIDHPEKSPNQPRSYGARFGVLRSARFTDGQGVFADLHYNTKHPAAEQVAWDAENSPESLGLSHNATVTSGRRGGREVIESIVRVRSVDIVADPATTNSLFESEQEPEIMSVSKAFKNLIDAVEADEDSGDGEMYGSKIRGMIKQLRSDGASMAQIAKAISRDESTTSGIESGDVKNPPKEVYTMLKSFSDGFKKKEKTPMEHIEENVRLKTELSDTKNRLEQIETKQRQKDLIESIDKDLIDAGFDLDNKDQVSDLFAKTLIATESVDDRKALISDRAALLKLAKPAKKGAAESGKPSYTAPSDALEHEVADTAAFARSLLS